jgi:hypothetical protein
MEYSALNLRQGSRGSPKSYVIIVFCETRAEAGRRSSACVHCKSLKVGKNDIDIDIAPTIVVIHRSNVNSVLEKPSASDARQESTSVFHETGRNANRHRTSDILLNLRDTMNQALHSTHEDLQEKAHSQDVQIQAILLQLDQMRTDNRIRELMARSQPVESHTNQGLSVLVVLRVPLVTQTMYRGKTFECGAIQTKLKRPIHRICRCVLPFPR